MLILGYALIIPPFQAPDEDRHLWRAFSVSEGRLLGTSQTHVPAQFLELRERFSPRFERVPQKRVVPAAEIISWLRRPLDPNREVAVANPNGNLYSLVPYLPASLVLRIGRMLDLSPLVQLYAGRLFNGAVYLILLALSLRVLPGFRLLTAALALTPMAVAQAASWSADSITLSLTMTLMTFVFRFAFQEGIATVSRRDMAILGVLLALVSSCKFNIWMALLVLVIPARKLGSNRAAALFYAGCAAIVCVVGLGWQIVNMAAVEAFRSAQAADGRMLADNLAFIWGHPIRFAGNFPFTVFSCWWLWCVEFVGYFGWLTIPLHPALVVVHIGVIIWAATADPTGFTLARRQKLALASFVVLTVVSVYTLIWVFETNQDWLRVALSGPVAVIGVCGRYFLPIALPALMLIGSRRRARFRARALPLLSITAAVNLAALATIWSVYH